MIFEWFLLLGIQTSCKNWVWKENLVLSPECVHIAIFNFEKVKNEECVHI